MKLVTPALARSAHEVHSSLCRRGFFWLLDYCDGASSTPYDQRLGWNREAAAGAAVRHARSDYFECRRHGSAEDVTVPLRTSLVR
jgi:hypothetical protein